MVGPVHCYSAELRGDLVLFDTGPPTAEAKNYLKKHIDLASLRHVCITHCHIDHCGLAAWLEKETSATIYLPYRDHLKNVHLAKRLKTLADFLRGMGFTATVTENILQQINGATYAVPYPSRYKIIEESLPDLGVQVLACPGHSQSDLVYTGDDWAITGDTLLKGVFQSPLLDVDLLNEGRLSNYEVYCQSLVKLSKLKGLQILPGHRGNVPDIDETLYFYLSKMLQRTLSLHPFRDEMNIAAIIDSLYGGLLVEPFHLYLKASEILFMKEFTQNPRLLIEAVQSCGLFDRLRRKIEAVIG